MFQKSNIIILLDSYCRLVFVPVAISTESAFRRWNAFQPSASQVMLRMAIATNTLTSPIRSSAITCRQLSTLVPFDELKNNANRQERQFSHQQNCPLSPSPLHIHTRPASSPLPHHMGNTTHHEGAMTITDSTGSNSILYFTKFNSPSPSHTSRNRKLTQKNNMADGHVAGGLPVTIISALPNSRVL
jgi:hypothetical protein